MLQRIGFAEIRTNMKPFDRKTILLLSIIAVGLFLRVYNLEEESFWVDEGYTVVVSGLDVTSIIEEAGKDSHPPLYHLILHFWIGFFGDSEYAARSLSVILGTLSVFMTYKVGSSVFDDKLGLLGSLIIGLSVFHIEYSQEARNYSLMVLLALCSYYYFIRLLAKNSIKGMTGYIIFTSLLMYTHVYGMFILFSQNIYFLINYISENKSKTSAKAWYFLQFVLLVLYAPWISNLVHQVTIIQKWFWIARPTIKSLGGTFLEYSGSYELLLFFVALAAFSLVGIEKIHGKIDLRKPIESAGSYLWKVRLLDVDKSFLLLIWLFVPIILPFIISQFTAPIYLKRCTIVASPAFYLLTARGVKNISNKLAVAAVLVSVGALSLVSVKEYYSKTIKEQWREVASHIEKNATAGDLILMNDGFHPRYVFDYYFKKSDVDIKPFTEKTRFIDEKNIAELDQAVKGYKRVWLLLSHSGDPAGLIIKRLSVIYNLIYYKKYVSIDLYLFEKQTEF